MNRKQSLSVYKVDVNIEHLQENEKLDKEILSQLEIKLAEVISKTSDENVKSILKNRVYQIKYLLGNLDTNVKLIDNQKNKHKRNIHRDSEDNNSTEADKILNQQLLKIYNDKKSSWSNNSAIDNKHKYLEKIYALSTIFERFDENMKWLGINEINKE